MNQPGRFAGDTPKGTVDSMKRSSNSTFRYAGGTLAVASALLLVSAGCSRQAPVAMAPPVQPAMAPPMAGGGMGGGMQPNGSAGVYQWQDVPVGQQVPVTRAVFDQGGYQLYCQTGETIVVPFVNQNMYVMKFGQSADGSTYFVNDGQVPTLYIPRGGSLENTVAQGARWYPFPQNYAYTQPVYMGLAPTWNDYLGMGWYPGMSYYGGYWGYHPGLAFSPMPGLMINIGGHPYYGWSAYRSYYYANPYSRVYVRSAPSYRYNSVGRQASSAFGRSSFGSTRSTTGSFSRTTGSTGSFGRSTGSTGSFGRSTGSTGSFGRASSGGSFGRTTTGSSGSFGRSSGFGNSSSGFGSSSRSTGSFGSGSSGFGSSSRRSSGSFGGSSSSGFGSSSRSSSSFGSSTRSSGFGSFGGSSGRSSSSFGSSRSSGGSFGRRH